MTSNGRAPRPGSDAVTVVVPRSRASPGKSVVAIAAFVGLIVPLGWLLDSTLSLLLAVGLMAGFSALWRWVRRLRYKGAGEQPSAPPQLEVSAEKIVLRHATATELHRADGDLLGVRELGRDLQLYQVDAGSTHAIGLGRFDVDEVGAAAVRHGWRWQPAEHTAADQPGHELVLREGRTDNLPGRVVIGIAATTAGLAVAVLIAGGWATQARWHVYLAAAVVFVLGVAVLLGWSFSFARRCRLTVRVYARYLTVRTGGFPPVTVRRSAVVSARAGRRWVRIRTTGPGPPAWVPLRPKRTEVLSTLWAYGWPVTDRVGPGG